MPLYIITKAMHGIHLVLFYRIGSVKLIFQRIFFLSRRNICNLETLIAVKHHFLNLGFVGQVIRLFPGKND